MHLVGDLLDLTPESARVFDEAVRSGRYVNERYADLLEAIGAGHVRGLAGHEFGDALLGGSSGGGGLLTRADLEAYRAEVRAPIALERAGARVWTNPPPSVGGSIVTGALARLPGRTGDRSVRWAEVAEALADATLAQRGPGQVPTGTTHVSVVDAEGGFAAITTSNGSGSGTVVPGWGVALNNMLGEEDLRPVDGSALPPGARMGSMMAPTLVELADGSRTALGTGGSERIRSALLGVLVRLIDEGRRWPTRSTLPASTSRAPVPSTSSRACRTRTSSSSTRWPAAATGPGLEPWPQRNLFFGGVHAVRRAADGTVEAVGDARRTGSVGIVLPDGSVRNA